MRALIKSQSGPGNMAVVDWPDPQPGPGEVVVEVKCTTICGTDVLVHDEKYVGKRPLPYPFVLGHEVAGVVAEVGEGVEGFKPGDRVGVESIIGCGTCYHCQRGNSNLCPYWHHIGLTMDGSFAQYIKVPQTILLHLPDVVTMEAASMLEPLGLAVHTMHRLAPRPSQPLAIVGPGPIGLLHLLVMKATGAGPILVLGMPGDEDRLEVAKANGADHVAAVQSREEAVALANGLTGGVGMELVIEATGSPGGVQTALDLVAGNGKLATVGLARITEVDALQIIRKNLTWYGMVAAVRLHYVEAIRMMAAGRVDPSRLITHRFSLEEGVEAVHMMKERKSLKAALVP